MTAPKPTKSRRNKRKKNGRIDVTAILTKPVNVGSNGRAQRMTPFEIGLRKQVKKALKDRSLNAIKSVFAIAWQFGLVEDAPPPPQNGGVRFIPTVLTKKEYARYEEAKAKGIISPEEDFKVELFERGAPKHAK